MKTFGFLVGTDRADNSEWSIGDSNRNGIKNSDALCAVDLNRFLATAI